MEMLARVMVIVMDFGQNPMLLQDVIPRILSFFYMTFALFSGTFSFSIVSLFPMKFFLINFCILV